MRVQPSLYIASVPSNGDIVALLLVPFIVYLYHDSFHSDNYGAVFRVLSFLIFLIPPLISLFVLQHPKPLLRTAVKLMQSIAFFGVSLTLLVFNIIFGLKTAAIRVGSDGTIGKAALELDSVACAVRFTQTNTEGAGWSGVLYIAGLAFSLSAHAAGLMTHAFPSRTKMKRVLEPKVSLDREDFKEANNTRSRLQDEQSKLTDKTKKEEEALRKSFEIVDTPPSFPPSSAKRMMEESSRKQPQQQPKPSKKPLKNGGHKRGPVPTSDPDSP